jgi:hypothetical protein
VFVGRSERDVALQATASIRPTGGHDDHNMNGNGGD